MDVRHILPIQASADPMDHGLKNDGPRVLSVSVWKVNGSMAWVVHDAKVPGVHKPYITSDMHTMSKSMYHFLKSQHPELYWRSRRISSRQGRRSRVQINEMAALTPPRL